MSRRFLTNLSLEGNVLENARIHVLASAPTTNLAAGLIYFNSTSGRAFYYDGEDWVAMDAIDAYLPDFGEQGDISASQPGDTAAAGSTGEIADAGHRHSREAWGTTSEITTSAVGDSVAAGASGKVADAAHKHARESFGSVGSGGSFGQSASDGSATTPARSSHQHAIPSHDGSAHSAISVSSLAAPTGDLSLATYKITNLGAPTAGSTDAATAAYVDSAVAAAVEGLSWKDSVRVASSADVTISGPGSSINSVSLSNGDRVLLYGQSTASQNGLYTYNGSAAAMTRTADGNTAAELRGAAVFVEEGSDQGKQFILTSDGFVLGTDDLVWVQFGAQLSYSNGNGLSLAGTTFSVNNGTGLTFSGTALTIDTSVVARKYAADLTGSATSYTVTHNLGTRDVHVTIYDTSTYETVIADVTNASTNTVTVGFATAPTSGAYRCVVVG